MIVGMRVPEAACCAIEHCLESVKSHRQLLLTSPTGPMAPGVKSIALSSLSKPTHPPQGAAEGQEESPGVLGECFLRALTVHVSRVPTSPTPLGRILGFL